MMACYIFYYVLGQDLREIRGNVSLAITPLSYLSLGLCLSTSLVTTVWPTRALPSLSITALGSRFVCVLPCSAAFFLSPKEPLKLSSAVPALRRLRQEGCKFEVSLSYIVISRPSGLQNVKKPKID